MDFYDVLVAFPIRLFFVLTPVASITVMLGLTRNMTNDEKITISIRACMYAMGILLVSVVVGRALFDIFGISLSSLRVAGGIYLFLLGLDMVNARSSGPIENIKKTKIANNDIAMTPLAMPLLSGPGTLSFIFVTRPELIYSLDFMLYCIGLFEAIFVICVCFIYAAKSSKKMSAKFIILCEKLMGLMVMSLGIDIVIHGAVDHFLN